MKSSRLSGASQLSLCRLVGCGEVVLPTQEDRVLVGCCDGSGFVSVSVCCSIRRERKEMWVG